MTLDEQIDAAIVRLMTLLTERRRPGRQQQVRKTVLELHELWQRKMEATP